MVNTYILIYLTVWFVSKGRNSKKKKIYKTYVFNIVDSIFQDLSTKSLSHRKPESEMKTVFIRFSFEHFRSLHPCCCTRWDPCFLMPSCASVNQPSVNSTAAFFYLGKNLNEAEEEEHNTWSPRRSRQFSSLCLLLQQRLWSSQGSLATARHMAAIHVFSQQLYWLGSACKHSWRLFYQGYFSLSAKQSNWLIS